MLRPLLTVHGVLSPRLASHAYRYSAARGLRLVAATLLRLSRRLTAAQPVGFYKRPITDLPRLEFHAEAGAPEGALYVDGEYVGHLPLTRL